MKAGLMFGKMKTDGRPITQLLLDEKTSDKERLGKCGSNFESDERRVTLFPGNGLLDLSGEVFSPELAAGVEPSTPIQYDRAKKLKRRFPVKTSTQTHGTEEHQAKNPRTEVRPFRHEDPWRCYRKLAYTEQGGEVIGAVELTDRTRLEVIAVKEVSHELSQKHLQTLLQLRNRNIVHLHDVFLHKSTTFLIYEMMYISVQMVIACHLTFTEPQVARLCDQV